MIIVKLIVNTVYLFYQIMTVLCIARAICYAAAKDREDFSWKMHEKLIFLMQPFTHPVDAILSRYGSTVMFFRMPVFYLLLTIIVNLVINGFAIFS